MSQDNKLSQEFSRRLGAFGPGDAVRVLVLLKTADSARRGGRMRGEARLAAVAALQDALAEPVHRLDDFLASHGGRRLAEVSALGSLPVELPPQGVRELADVPWVQAILEDQALQPVR